MTPNTIFVRRVFLLILGGTGNTCKLLEAYVESPSRPLSTLKLTMRMRHRLSILSHPAAAYDNDFTKQHGLAYLPWSPRSFIAHLKAMRICRFVVVLSASQV